MRIFGLFSLFIWLLIFVLLAIMFDWFGARDISMATLKHAETGIEMLEETGDAAMEFMNQVSGESSESSDFKLPELPEMPKDESAK